MSDKHKTERLRLSQIRPNHPAILASLEKINRRFPGALKLGYAVALRELTYEMMLPGATADLVDIAQEFLDALRFMPWEGAPAREPAPAPEPSEDPETVVVDEPLEPKP